MRRGRRLLAVMWVLAACSGGEAGKTHVGRDGGIVAEKPTAGQPKKIQYETPTTEECDAALATLVKVVPDGVVGDAVDMKYCMQMPKQAVRCLAGVKSEAEADACLEGYAAAAGPVKPVAGTGAGTKPPGVPADVALATEADCRKAVENVRRLVPGMTATDDEMIKQCAGSEPAADVACLAAAKTTQELDACDLQAD
jgi:hypothetical protein